MKQNAIVFLGKINTSGKMSVGFLKKFLKYEFKNFDTFYYEELSKFEIFSKNLNESYKKILVFPIYREAYQSYLKKISKGKFCEGIDLAKSADGICKQYGNFIVFHNSRMGEIVGDKIKTNIFLSYHGIKCPKIIQDRNYSGKVFVNEIGDSASPTKVLNNGSEISDQFYNTEFIDTTFEYKNKKYYSAPRIMAIGKEIVEIQVRLRDASENNPNVHVKHASVDLDLLNSYYDEVIFPKIGDIEQICKKIYEAAGFGFYNHDFLICSKTQEVYVSEIGYKFDNVVWKEKTKSIVDRLKSETNQKETHQKIFSIFEKELASII